MPDHSVISPNLDDLLTRAGLRVQRFGGVALASIMTWINTAPGHLDAALADGAIPGILVLSVLSGIGGGYSSQEPYQPSILEIIALRSTNRPPRRTQRPFWIVETAFVLAMLYFVAAELTHSALAGIEIAAVHAGSFALGAMARNRLGPSMKETLRTQRRTAQLTKLAEEEEAGL